MWINSHFYSNHQKNKRIKERLGMGGGYRSAAVETVKRNGGRRGGGGRRLVWYYTLIELSLSSSQGGAH